MQQFEYRVVPAPKRGEKAQGLKTTEDRFAQALTILMNDMARQGWDYLRADTLPCEERTGLTGKATVFQNMLVFRRALPPSVLPAVAAEAAQAPRLGAAEAVPGNAPPLGGPPGAPPQPEAQP